MPVELDSHSFQARSCNRGCWDRKTGHYPGGDVHHLHDLDFHGLGHVHQHRVHSSVHAARRGDRPVVERSEVVVVVVVEGMKTPGSS